MKFVNIEGDNGVGKDTLAQKLIKYNYDILNYDSDVIKHYNYAKKFNGPEKVEKFLDYSEYCGNKINNMNLINKDIILIRYWISSLAAAYADYIYDYEKVMEQAQYLYSKLVKPDIVIRLLCNYEERIARILLRKANNLDDKTIVRDKRYLWIVNEIKRAFDFNWVDIDTTNLSESDVEKQVIKILKI